MIAAAFVCGAAHAGSFGAIRVGNPARTTPPTNGVDVSGAVSGTYFDPISGQFVPAHIQALAFHPDGRLFGARDALGELDPQTGEFSLIGGSGFGDVRGLAYVPEPSSAELVGAGLLVLLLARRRALRVH